MPVAYHDGRFPPADIDWPRLLPLIGPANAAIARRSSPLAATHKTSTLTPLRDILRLKLLSGELQTAEAAGRIETAA